MADPLPTRRRGRRWLVRFAVVGLLLMLAAWFAPAVVAKTGLRQAVLARVFADLDGTVAAGSASFGWLSPIELRDVTFADRAGLPILRSERVTSARTLLALALDQSDLGTFTVERPVLEVVCESDSTNVERAIARYLVDDGTPPSPQRTALAVTVEQGRVVLKDATEEKTLDPFGLTVTVPASRSEPVALKLTAGGPESGTLAADCTFADASTVAVTAERFAAESLGPLVGRFSPGTVAAGRVSGKASIGWGADRTAIEGRAEVVGLDLAGPWLGADRVRLQRAEVPCKLELASGEVRIESAELTCDVGTLSAAGTINPAEPAEKLLSRAGLNIAADIDLAKLVAVLPQLLRVRQGTELREGRVNVRLTSTAGPDGTTWDATARTTSLKGVRDGRAIGWDTPLDLEVAGRLRADGLPVFDKLVCRSEFVAINARGTPEQFVAAANADLDRLAARLGEFVDLGGLRLEGTAALTLRTLTRPEGGFTADGSARLTRFTIADKAGRGLSEPDLLAEVRASGRRDPAGPIRLDGGEATLTAGADRLTASLVEPVADARTARTGKLAVQLAGDLGRWRTRLGWLGIPTDWQVGGTGTAAGVVTLTADGVTAERIRAEVTNARFRGSGVDLSERTLSAEAGLAFESQSGSVAFLDPRMSCESLGLSAKRLDLKPAVGGGYGLVGSAAVTANVNRVQRAVGLQSDPAGADALGGMASGTVTLDTAAAPMTFDADLVIDKFTLGPAAKPAWTEPRVKLVTAGVYDTAADALRFRGLKLERDGLAADARGSLAKITTTPEVSLEGALAYDLAKLEPTLKAYLGKDAKAVGKDSRPFKLSGKLGDGGKNLTAAVGQPRSPFDSLSGSAAVAWQSVRAYGFEVGAAELKAALDRGTLKASPVEATFGGGKVRLEPTVHLTGKDYDLTFAKGRVVERARLTPAACADALGFALPAVANAAQADGTFSFDLEESRVPLSDPDRAAVRGKLTVHTATVSPGPLVTEIATLFGAKQTTLPLATEQVVPVRLENGRVHHENFTIRIGQSDVRSSGSVGLDGGVSLVLDLPVPPRALDRLLSNNPILRESLSKQRIKVPVGGTLQRPRLDAKAFDDAVAGVMRGAAKDAAGGLIEKGRDRLLDELLKRAQPPKK
jgi:hypothetical protein